MRKQIVLLALTISLVLTACGNSNQSENEDPLSGSNTVVQIETPEETNVQHEESQDEQQSETPDSDATEGERILVAYFSWADNAVLEGDVDAVSSPSVVPTGDVAHLAFWVQEATGGDIFSIQVTEPYSSDWDECLSRANEEKADDARPELTASVENMSDYDVVFIGYPNWWYSCPMAVLSFIEENDLAGKQVYLFCSHGTGGLANSVEDITAELPNSNISEHVFDVYEEEASSSQTAIQEWVEELGY